MGWPLTVALPLTVVPLDLVILELVSLIRLVVFDSSSDVSEPKSICLFPIVDDGCAFPLIIELKGPAATDDGFMFPLVLEFPEPVVDDDCG